MVQRRVAVDPRDIVLLRSILEAYEGLAMLTGTRPESLERRVRVVTLSTPRCRASELDTLICELGEELAIRPVDDDTSPP
jgi:hypothetical protein